MARGEAGGLGRCVGGSVGLQAQPVYKWVDANGKTHYGSQPPADKDDAAPMKLQAPMAPPRAVRRAPLVQGRKEHFDQRGGVQRRRHQEDS